MRYLWLAVSLLASSVAWAGSIQPHDPRCEYRVDPLGIDELKPRLSWELRAADSSARDLRQTACRILAAGGREALEAG